MFKFTPLPPEKLEERGDFELLSAGEYDFEVKKATEERSKSGNDMIKLTLSIFHGDREYRVWDYLTFTEKGQWKPYNFAKATNLVEKFKAGEMSAFDCEGKTGEVKIGIQKGTDGNPDQNKVVSYIVKDGEKSDGKPLDDSDSIPF